MGGLLRCVAVSALAAAGACGSECWQLGCSAAPERQPPVSAAIPRSPADASAAEAATREEAEPADADTPPAVDVSSPPMSTHSSLPGVFSHQHDCPKSGSGPRQASGDAGAAPPSGSEKHLQALRDNEARGEARLYHAVNPCLDKHGPANATVGQWLKVDASYEEDGRASQVKVSASMQVAPALVSCAEKAACRVVGPRQLGVPAQSSSSMLPLVQYEIAVYAPKRRELEGAILKLRAELHACYRKEAFHFPDHVGKVILIAGYSNGTWGVDSPDVAQPEASFCVEPLVRMAVMSLPPPRDGPEHADVVVYMAPASRR
ncbi:MAG: hypothetical protein HY898_14515 [Deltaproteobacteria bacterium]|nr:hypothetical protein [Deltaproteobacteria bacterium]